MHVINKTSQILEIFMSGESASRDTQKSRNDKNYQIFHICLQSVMTDIEDCFCRRDERNTEGLTANVEKSFPLANCRNDELYIKKICIYIKEH